jgi:uncharacterized membrane protein YoaK (UPF0700 family)
MAEAPDHKLVPLMLVLSVVTGLVDAVSVLGLGKVFTANMTGNIVFLGFALANAPGFQLAPSLTALALFLAGAALGGRVAVSVGPGQWRRWILIEILFEAALLGLAAWLAVRLEAARYPVIALTAAAMGFRSATVRRMKVTDLTTTVLTLTIAGLAADSLLGGGDNPNWLRRIGGVLAILSGAVLGAWLLITYGLAAPLALGAILTLGAGMLTAWRIA